MSEPWLELLARVVKAFEEQNRITTEWIALQIKWREEGDPISKRILALQEKNAKRDQAWHDESQEMLEARERAQDAMQQVALEAYLESLKAQKVEKRDVNTQ